MWRPRSCCCLFVFWPLLAVVFISASVAGGLEEQREGETKFNNSGSNIVIIPPSTTVDGNEEEEEAAGGGETQLPLKNDDNLPQTEQQDSNTCECKSSLPFLSSAADLDGTYDMINNNLRGNNATTINLSLLLALPLTYKGEAKLNPGLFQLASALMAIDHFNQRNSAIIPELNSLQDCPIQIDYDMLHILDTGTVESNAMSQIMIKNPQRVLPHAIVGPYNEIPAIELSVVASTLHIPMITHRGLDHNLLLPTHHPFVTQINPNLYADMAFLGDYLEHTNRSDYIAILYASNADSAIQRLEIFRGIAQQSLDMKNIKSFGYHSPPPPLRHNMGMGTNVSDGGGGFDDDYDRQHHPHPRSAVAPNISTAMEQVKESGYRTIVWLTPWFDSDMFLVGHAAHEYGLDQGDHFWVIGAAMEIDRPMEHAQKNNNNNNNNQEGIKAGREDYFDSTDEDHENSWSEMFQEESQLFDHQQNHHDNHDHDWQKEGGDNIPSQEMLNTMFNSIKEINFMRNAAFLTPAELIDVRDPNDSPFMKEWTKLNETFVDRLLELNPIDSQQYNKEWMEYMILSPLMGWTKHKDFPKGNWPPKDLFSNPVPFLSSPPSGALHLYDAIMAIGFGGCEAAKALQNQQQNSSSRRITQEEAETNQTVNVNNNNNNNNTVSWSGELLQDGIRSAQFTGASGKVLFGDGSPGARKGTTVSYHVINMFPTGFVGDLYSVSEVRNATDWQWYEVKPFIYAGGSTSPPELLRDPADQNYLSKGVRAAGLTLMSIALLAILVAFIWVAVYRHHSIVVAAQPVFLYFLCMGSAVTSLAIFFLSVDESHGWSEEQLTKTCKTIPWLVVLGHIWTYNCLFTKLWRVNRVLQFSRRKVNLSHVLWPAWMIEAAAIILLSIWTATTTLQWQRIEIDPVTGESMGKCDGDVQGVLGILVVILVMIPTVLTGIMAWKTIDVDAAYSEAKWIFALMLVQCQVIFVGVPLVFILEDVSTDGRFLGSALILWTFPMTTIGLIIVPKMIAVHFPENLNGKNTRGSTTGTRVPGIGTFQESQAATARSPSHVSRQMNSSSLNQSSNVSRSTNTPLPQAQMSSLRHMHVTQI